jgi:hypothetical protein
MLRRLLLAVILCAAMALGRLAAVAADHGGIWYESAMGNTETVKRLLEKGSNPNAKGGARGPGECPTTALMMASHNGHMDVMELLIKHGATVDAQDDYGDTALMKAIARNRTEAARLLLKHGADVNIKNIGGTTALIIAAINKHATIMEDLLAKGADVNTKDEQGRTALNWSVLRGDHDAVRILVKHGAKIHPEDIKTARSQEAAEILQLITKGKTTELPRRDAPMKRITKTVDERPSPERTREYPAFWGESHYVEMKDNQTGTVAMRQYPDIGVTIFKVPSTGKQHWNIYEDKGGLSFGPNNLVAYAKVDPIEAVVDRESIPQEGLASRILQAHLAWHIFTPVVEDPKRFAEKEIVLTDSRWRVVGQIRAKQLIVAGPVEQKYKTAFAESSEKLEAAAHKLGGRTGIDRISTQVETFSYDSLSRRIGTSIEVEFYSEDGLPSQAGESNEVDSLPQNGQSAGRLPDVGVTQVSKAISSKEYDATAAKIWASIPDWGKLEGVSVRVAAWEDFPTGGGGTMKCQVRNDREELITAKSIRWQVKYPTGYFMPQWKVWWPSPRSLRPGEIMLVDQMSAPMGGDGTECKITIELGDDSIIGPFLFVW